jgi:hypothetical protein
LRSEVLQLQVRDIEEESVELSALKERLVKLQCDKKAVSSVRITLSLATVFHTQETHHRKIEVAMSSRKLRANSKYAQTDGSLIVHDDATSVVKAKKK